MPVRDDRGSSFWPCPVVGWSVELLLYQLEVHAFFGHQFLVPALFDDRAFVQHQDAVGAHDGAQAMGDDDGGAAAQDFLHVAEDVALGLRVEG